VAWLLCDYGEVLSLAPSADDRAALVEATGIDDPWPRYWEFRPGYDRGDLAVGDYWTKVLGSPPGPAQLRRLIEVDTLGWLHPNQATLAAASRAAARGWRLAILSNAPAEVAGAIDAQEWLAGFSPRLFSWQLRGVKPEPMAYELALKALKAGADEVVFFDDRPINVEAATRAGIRAHLFQDPSQLDGIGPA
jgi:putative hydrolase of the HAD superfamily